MVWVLYIGPTMAVFLNRTRAPRTPTTPTPSVEPANA
jgi:hypothetical protein